MLALSLEENLLSTAGAGSYIKLKGVVTDESQSNISLNSYNGFLAIGSEIIEYDAIQYDYVDLADGIKKQADITTQLDALKYLGLSAPGSANFQPNGKYRIKTRGAYNTTPENHYATAQATINAWSGYDVVWV